MHRPDIELYIKRLDGLYGVVWQHNMKHVGMDKLLAYTLYLEKKVGEQDDRV